MLYLCLSSFSRSVLFIFCSRYTYFGFLPDSISLTELSVLLSDVVQKELMTACSFIVHSIYKSLFLCKMTPQIYKMLYFSCIVIVQIFQLFLVLKILHVQHKGRILDEAKVLASDTYAH